MFATRYPVNNTEYIDESYPLNYRVEFKKSQFYGAKLYYSLKCLDNNKNDVWSELFTVYMDTPSLYHPTFFTQAQHTKSTSILLAHNASPASNNVLIQNYLVFEESLYS